MGVTIRDSSNVDKLKKNLKKLGRKEIKVGVFGSDDSELVIIAGVHEFGTEIKVTNKMRGWFAANGYPLKKSTTTITIPERSFLRSGYDENVNEIANKIEELVPDVLEGQIDTKVFMDMIGLEFAGKIQKKLRDLKNPANSSMTTERKKSGNPLIDTGRLVGAIRHEVE
jgi:hypothetical protein